MKPSQLDTILSMLADKISDDRTERLEESLRHERAMVERATFVWALYEIQDAVHDNRKPADKLKEIDAIVEKALAKRADEATPTSVPLDWEYQ